MKRADRSAPWGAGLALLATAFALGCVAEPGDEQLAEPLRVTSISVDDGASRVSTRPTIRIDLSEYLDPDSFDDFSPVWLVEGDDRASGWITYELVDRRLSFRPFRRLRGNAIYALKLDESRLRSYLGGNLATFGPVEFRTGVREAVSDDAPPGRPMARYGADVEPLLEAGCSCHFAPETVLPSLRRDDLVGVPSRARPSRLLVEPFDAPRSYLMHKLLPDYRDRYGTRMPPPWSEHEPLDLAALRVVERWIATGARP